MDEYRKKKYKPFDPNTFTLNLSLRQEHVRFKIEPDRRTRNEEVQVYWDLDKAPVDEYPVPSNTPVKFKPTGPYDVSKVKERILHALHVIDPHLKIGTFTAVGDSSLLPDDFVELIDEQGITFIDAKLRLPQCKSCKIQSKKKTVPGEKTDAANIVLNRKLIGDVVDRGTPGIILLITGDCDYSETLRTLRNRRMKVLVAQGRATPARFRTFADLTWFWDAMKLGYGPHYYCPLV